MRNFFKKLLSFLLINLIFLNILNFNFAFADANNYSNSVIFGVDNIDSYKPWDDILFYLWVTNLTTVDAINPFVYFKPNDELNFIPNTFSGFVQYNRTSTIPTEITWYDWINSFTWILSINQPASTRFWARNVTYNIPQNYPHKTIDFELVFWADNFNTLVHPKLNDPVFHVNVTPHIQSISLSKSAVYNNWVDYTDLTVKILDYNWCSNMVWAWAYVNADLSWIWLSNESLTFDSCLADGVTSVFKKTNIKPNAWIDSWSYNFEITAWDIDWNIAWSDSFYSSFDLVKTGNIIINSSSSPQITFLNYNPEDIYSLVNPNLSLQWQSSQSWDYKVNFWVESNCNSWINIWSWTLSSWETITTSFDITDSKYLNWNNKFVVCVTNIEPTTWSNTVDIFIDKKAPVIKYESYTTKAAQDDINILISSNENGTYEVFINWNNSWVSWNMQKDKIVNISILNSLLTVNPWNNEIFIKSTDIYWNAWNSSSINVYKDFTPPPWVTNVLVQDCDFIWTTNPVCLEKWNPKAWISGRDFYVTWDKPADFPWFLKYDIYALKSWTPFNINVLQSLKQIFDLTQTGTFLNEDILLDSAREPFVNTWSQNYDIYVLITKNNWLVWDFWASLNNEITADNVVLPTLEKAAFVDDTTLELTYLKNLNTDLSKYDTSKITSTSNCFTFDTNFSWADYVVWNKVWFKINSILDSSKTCSDLSISQKAIYDFEWLYNQEELTWIEVLDKNLPKINISLPWNTSFIWWTWIFSLNYSLSETMSGSTLWLKFTNSSWAIIDYPISTNTLSWSYSVLLNGNTIWLTSWKKYDLVFVWDDLNWNSWVSNIIWDFVFDVTPPSKSTLLNLFWIFNTTWNSTPSFSRTWSVDNYSAVLKYHFQIAKDNSFTQIVYDRDELTGNWSTLDTPLSEDWVYFYRVFSIDESLNISQPSDVLSFTLDTIPPVFYQENTIINNIEFSFTWYVKNWNHIDILSKSTDTNQWVFSNTDFKVDLTPIWGVNNQTATSYDTSNWNLKFENILVNCSVDWVKNIVITWIDKWLNSAQITKTLVCDNTQPNFLQTDVISPISNQFVKWWDNFEIKWNPDFYNSELSPVLNPISLYYSQDNWITYNEIALNISNSWSYIWSTPSLNSQVKLKFVVKDKLDNKKEIIKDITIDSLKPTILENTFVSLWTGSILKWNTNFEITWNAWNISDNIWLKTNPIKLEYSLDWWNNFILIWENISNSWSYNWLVPEINSNNFLIKLTAFDNSWNFESINSWVNIIDSTIPTLDIDFAWGWDFWGATPPNLSYINNSWIDISLSSLDDYLDEVFYKLQNIETWKYFDWNNFVLDNENYISICKDNWVLSTDMSCSNIFQTLNFWVLDANNYKLTFKSIDEAWNENISNSINYIWDLVNPNVWISWTWSIYFSWSLNILWTSSDLASWISSVRVWIKKDEKYFDWSDFVDWVNLLSTQTSNNYLNWNYLFSPSFLEVDWQNYELNVFWYDKTFKNNNETNITRNLILDKTWPSLSWNSINFDTTKVYTWWTLVNISWDKNLVLDSWVWLANNPISVWYNIWNWFVLLASNLENTWNYTFSLPFVDSSTSRILLRANDKLWNNSEFIYTNLFRIDSSVPTIEKIETKSDWVSWVWWVIVYFSEEIKSIDTLDIPNIFTSSEWTFSNWYSYSLIDGKSVLELNFITSLNWTNKTPTITFAWDIIWDFAWNKLASWNLISIDKAEPRILKAEIFDQNLNWKFDKIEVSFSENINSTSFYSNFDLNNSFDWMQISWVTISWNIATLSLQESILENTNSNWITLSFNWNWNYTDLNGNISWSLWVPKNLIDKANPVLVEALLTHNDYVASNLSLKFSEELTWTFSWFTTNIWNINFVSNSLNNLDFSVNWISTTNPDVKLNYVWDLTDENWNLLTQITNYSVKELIPPRLESVKTLDLDNNAKVDNIELTFSENITWNFNDFNLSSLEYNLKSNQEFSFTWTNKILVPLQEKTLIDTSWNLNLNINSNSTITDLNWNAVLQTLNFASNDWVWVVIKQARFDEWDSKMYLTFSENINSLNIWDFNISWMWWNLVNISFTWPSNEAILIFDSNVIDYQTAQISFKPNTVWDNYLNKFSTNYYSKVTSSIVINEVYFDSNLKYIELYNLSSVSVDISNYVIKNALWNWIDYTLPSWSIIDANWYYLISNWDSYYSWITSDRIAWLNIESNLYLTNSWVEIDGFWFKNMQTKKSLQRLDSCWNWLDNSCFVSSVASEWFVDNSYKWTPKSLNITDYELPIISSFSPENNFILPKNNSYNFDFVYQDNAWWVWIDSLSINFEIFKFNWTTFDKINWLTTTWSINDSNSSFVFNWTPNYWKYKAVFSVWDFAWNIKTQNIDFYVDDFSIDLSTDNIDFGNIAFWELKYWDIVNVSVKTIWAPFEFNHNYSNNDLWDYSQDKWFWACLGENCSVLENFKTKNIISKSKDISTDWNLKIYNFKIKYWVSIDSKIPAWNYNIINNYNFVVNY